MAKIIPFPGNRDDKNDDHDEIDTHPFDRDLGAHPDEIRALISGDPDRWTSCFSIEPHLNQDDIQHIPVLVYARALLQTIQTHQPVKATSRGHLPVAVVKELFQGAMAEAEPWFTKVAREDHSPVLSRTRRLAQDAGVLALRSKTFLLTKAGTDIVNRDDVNQLYQRLVRAALLKPQRLEAYDRLPRGGITVQTVPLLLHAVRTDTVLYEEDLSDLLYAVFRRSLDTDADGEEFDALVALRFFQRFGEFFGLFRPLPKFQHPLMREQDGRRHYRYGRWERTALFDSAIHWSIAPPKQAFQTPEMAAHYWVSPVHELQMEINGTKDYTLTGDCLRAVERCPWEADAYGVLARLYEGEPERVLFYLDQGLTATSDREPEIPPGVSPWQDYLYRDVLRLHFIRAETLLELKRPAEAIQEYEALLKIDPEDGMGAALWYVPALIEWGRYADAQRVHHRYCGTFRPDTPWTDALLAWATGNRDDAKTHLAEALKENALVPDALFGRGIVFPDDPREQYDAEDAVFYAERAASAWRRVPGAKEWLRRHRG